VLSWFLSRGACASPVFGSMAPGSMSVERNCLMSERLATALGNTRAAAREFGSITTNKMQDMPERLAAAAQATQAALRERAVLACADLQRPSPRVNIEDRLATLTARELRQAFEEEAVMRTLALSLQEEAEVRRTLALSLQEHQRAASACQQQADCECDDIASAGNGNTCPGRVAAASMEASAASACGLTSPSESECVDCFGETPRSHFEKEAADAHDGLGDWLLCDSDVNICDPQSPEWEAAHHWSPWQRVDQELAIEDWSLVG
jgi:hypothetical protein